LRFNQTNFETYIELISDDHRAHNPKQRSADPLRPQAGKICNSIGDVVRLSELAKWTAPLDAFEELFRLALEEELGRNGSGCDAIDGDALCAKLLGEDP